MDVPALVASSLGDEDVAAHVPLKGEDAVFVTPTRTIRYEAEGLLSDESVTEFSHDAERVEVSEGRRTATITLDYGLDGEQSLSVPGANLDDVLHPVLAGVLNAADVTGSGETVKRTYRFSELTLVVTSDRVVKHVGGAVWDAEFEQIAFADVTGITAEEGTVSSQVVLETAGRTQRIKAPNEQFRDVRETIEDALFAYHDVDSRVEFEQTVSPAAEQSTDDAAASVAFDSGVEPIEANLPETDAEPAAEADEGAATPTAETDGDSGAPGATSQQDAGQETPSDAVAEPSTATAADAATATTDERPSNEQPTGAAHESAGTDTGRTGAAEGAADSTATAPPGADAGDATMGDASNAPGTEAGDATGTEADELAASGFEAATASLESEVDTAAIVAELDAVQEALDLQRDVLEEQQARLDAIRELLPEN